MKQPRLILNGFFVLGEQERPPYLWCPSLERCRSEVMPPGFIVLQHHAQGNRSFRYFLVPDSANRLEGGAL